MTRRAASMVGVGIVVLGILLSACGTSSTVRTATPTGTLLPTATATAASTLANVYFAANGASSSTVYALDAATGHVRWSRHAAASGGSATQIASTGDIVILVDPTDKMTALRMEDGTVLWTHASTSGGRSVGVQPVADSGILYVTSGGGGSGTLNHTLLDAYRASDGTRLWEHDEGANAPVALAAANGVLYANIGLGVGLEALRGTDGTTLWQSKMSEGALPFVAGNVVYLNNFGDVYAFSAATGAPLWEYTAPQLATPSDLTVSVGGGLVFASNSLRVNALHASGGTLAWYNEYHGLVEGPSYANGVLYLSVRTTLYALYPLDGSQIWSAAVSGNASWPAVLADGTLYQSRSDAETATPAGYIYALNPASGAVQWKYTQSGVGLTDLIVV